MVYPFLLHTVNVGRLCRGRNTDGRTPMAYRLRVIAAFMPRKSLYALEWKIPSGQPGQAVSSPAPAASRRGRGVGRSPAACSQPKSSHSGNHVIPIFCGRGYDGNLDGRAIKARSNRKNRSTLMWKNSLNLAEIVRRKIGHEYDGSEARNKSRTKRIIHTPIHVDKIGRCHPCEH
jgi:hypothetical protein